MKKFVLIIDKIVSRFWLCFCICIFAAALIIKACYNMRDFPYFSENLGIDIILMVLLALVYFYLFKKASIIETKIKYWMLWAFFGILGILYVCMVPIAPFSDMQYVTEGALLFAKGDIHGILASEYLQIITKNLKVSMFYGFFALLLPKSVISLRIINVVFYLMIAQFMGLIIKNLGLKYSKFAFLLTASYLPLLLYCNHVYFDLPTLLMCTLAVFFYTRGKEWKNMILCGVFLGLGSSLRILVFILAIAIMVDYVFHNGKELFEHGAKKLLILFMLAAITCVIPKAVDLTVNSFFRIQGAEDESIWNLFWMGINEEEFGFMHNEISGGKKSFDDFYQLLISRNAKQNIRLFGRKIFWTWSQGTYQAQRYAFGGDVNASLDKFMYVTPVTNHLLNDNQIARKLINSFCRAQYLALLLFMIFGLLRIKGKELDKYRVFIYLMFGTFLILIFYEMKSRYVLHCFIPMLILAIRGMYNINREESD